MSVTYTYLANLTTDRDDDGVPSQQALALQPEYKVGVKNKTSGWQRSRARWGRDEGGDRWDRGEQHWHSWDGDWQWHDGGNMGVLRAHLFLLRLPGLPRCLSPATARRPRRTCSAGQRRRRAGRTERGRSREGECLICPISISSHNSLSLFRSFAHLPSLSPSTTNHPSSSPTPAQTRIQRHNAHPRNRPLSGQALPSVPRTPRRLIALAAFVVPDRQDAWKRDIRYRQGGRAHQDRSILRMQGHQ